MKNKKNQSFVFQIGHSITALLITCVVAGFFMGLLCFYPGPEFMGSGFWPVLALPGLLCLGTGYKVLFRKPIVQIDGKGITFFRSKIFIAWQQMQSAQVLSVDKGDGDPEDFLVVKYINAQGTNIVQTDFKLTGTMNKQPDEVMGAIKFFEK